MKCKGPCQLDKKVEEFDVRGEPVGVGICYSCTKLIRKEKRKAYARDYYREYRKSHPEETAEAQKRAQIKLKERRKSAKMKRILKAYVADNITTKPPEKKEDTGRLTRLQAIKSRLQETREELQLEMTELKKKGEVDMWIEIEMHDLRTAKLIRTVEEQIKEAELN